MRRLHVAGARMRHEDALVDLVIGLEALLGTSDERTELGYRFRVRGAVVLSPDRHKRRDAMKKLQQLYNLRSRVVHGEGVDSAELAAALPFAERALRNVWQWYFVKYPNARDNRAGIARIDSELLGP